MKKIPILCMAMVALAAGASAQNLLDNKPTTNDTIFKIGYDGQMHYIMSSDVTSREGDVYHLTEAKFFELDSIRVLLMHYVSLYEETPAGTWESIWVHHPWDSYFPTGGVRMLLIPFIEADDGTYLDYHKIVFNIRGDLVFQLMTI